jgi:hypothetical protein
MDKHTQPYFIIDDTIDRNGFSAIGLEQCHVCSRRFAPDRIKKHTIACQIANKKRKVFDSLKMRVAGTEAASYVLGKKKTLTVEVKSKPQNNWREKHKDFIQAIRYAKKMTDVEKSGGNIFDMPLPPVSLNPDYIQCSNCGRKFNQVAASRHIPRCKDIINRPKPPPHLRNISLINNTSVKLQNITSSSIRLQKR